MSLVALTSVGLVILLGFAAHRASLCTVKAVLEVMTSGTAYILASFARAAVWATAVSGAILLASSSQGMPVLQSTPVIYMLAGGFIFGVGAAVNGGCSLSTVQRLADGDLGIAGTLFGLVAGVVGWGLLEQRFGLSALHPISTPWAAADGWALALLAAIWLWVMRDGLRLWRSRDRATNVLRRLGNPAYRLSSAGVIIGIAGGILYTLQGAWTYTNFLRNRVAADLWDTPSTTGLHGFLVLALFAGMLLSSWQRHSFALKFDWRAGLGRHLAGGILMGVGGAAIPGGNDTLILAGIPTVSVAALATYFALLAGVASALLLMRARRGGLPPVVCADDRCA